MHSIIKKILLVFVLHLMLLTACNTQANSSSTDLALEQTSTSDTVVVDNNITEISTDITVDESSSAEPASTVSVANSVTQAIAENSEDHDDAEDYDLDSNAETQIVLSGDAIEVTGGGAEVNGRSATITAAGTYRLTGSLTDGQIIVDTEDEETVHLVFDGINISNESTAPIYIANAEETVIMLAEDSENFVTDGATYVFTDPEEDEPNATVFSKDDLTIFGEGSLTVEAQYNDGIASKDGLIITSGTINVNAVDDGIRGKDYLIIKNGNITVNAQGDGLKSDEDEDTTKGYVSIEGGTIQITSGGDAIQAETDVLITDGEFTLISGGGSSGMLAADASAKGIKAAVNVNIDGGTFTIQAADDAVHSNGSMVINGGKFDIATGDDGFHADTSLVFNGGYVNITESYEGIESALITINHGEFYVVSSDDGINVAGGNDGSGFGMGGQRPGGNEFAESGNYHLYINGGYIFVDAGGDGLDSNGAVDMTGGFIIVNGPTNNGNGPLDYMGSFNLTGGFLVAVGSSGMAQAPSESSTIYSLMHNFDTMQAAGTLVHIESASGENILMFMPTKEYQSVLVSSADLQNGETYTVYSGGSATGTATDGLYTDGTYTPGNQVASYTLSSVVTSNGGGMMGGFGGPGGGRPGGGPGGGGAPPARP